MTSPEVLIGRAAGHYAAGNLKTAANLCRRVLKGSPYHADALHLLGVVTYKAGDPGRAARYLKDALAQGRPDPEIYRNLGFALRDSGDLTGAAHSYREALALAPSDTVSHFQLGVLLGERDENEQTVWHFDQVLLRDPGNGLAHYNRAKALLALSRITEAEQEYAAASRRLSADYRVFSGWGTTLSLMERPEEARLKFILALEQEPPPQIMTDLLTGIGGTHRDQGNLDEARARYEVARERDLTHAEAAAGLAAVCERERDYQGSYDLIHPFTGDDPPPVSVATVFARIAPHLDKTELAIERLEAAAAQDSLPPHQSRRLHFALGNLKDSVGECETAFTHYRTANDLYTDSHNPAVHTNITDQKIEAVGQAEAARLRLPEAPSDLPVFIL
ncbi:MAG: tetratricopeptide repeat protein, partial [Alphaproteobacteria bacterium]|nr:tetratricopeptide repeat protein [Alphaproteobacteria bacterium]